MHAIEVHTTGCPNMSLLDKIIFVADYIEPGRDKQPRLDLIRSTAFSDLDLCVFLLNLRGLKDIIIMNNLDAIKIILGDPRYQNAYEISIKIPGLSKALENL